MGRPVGTAHPGTEVAATARPLFERREAPAVERGTLQLVPDGRTLRRRRTVAALIAGLGIAAVFATLLGLAAFQTFLAQGQAQLDALERRVRTEEARQEELRLAVAQLESPERILAEAQVRLGMLPPEPGDVTWLIPSAATAAEVARSAAAAADGA